MGHRFFGTYAVILIIPQHFIKQVKSLLTTQMSILTTYEVGPRLFGERFTPDQPLALLWYRQTIFPNVAVQILVAKNPHYSYQLIKIIGALEEGILFEDH